MTDSRPQDLETTEVETTDESAPASESELLDESLVEEVSIDGMCGVY